jgi:hypothetical protein
VAPLDFWMGFNVTGGGYYPPGPSSGAGLRYGALKRGNQVITQAFCIVAESGELACTLDEPSPSAFGSVEIGPYEARVGLVAGAVHGTLQVVDTDEISGSGKLYAAPGKVLADGHSVIEDFTITSGSLSDQNRALELTISAFGELLTLSMSAFDRYYYGDSSLLGLAAVYPFFGVFGDYASLSIDADGALFSQAGSGCVLTGLVAIIDPTLNLYAVDVTASNCSALNGAYEGFATVAEIPPDNAITRLKIAVFNDTSFIAGDVIGW